MKTSQEITKIMPDFLKAQMAMEPPTKDAVNPFFHSKYADLNSVMDACKGELNKNDIAVLQPLMGMTVETILIHVSGEWLSSETPIVCKVQNDPQALGSAITYARRYGLQSMVGLSAEDDDAEKATSRTEAEKPSIENLSQDQSEHTCSIHNVKMKERLGKNGGRFFDHRQQIDGVWNTCVGEGWKAQENRRQEYVAPPLEVPERQINEEPLPVDEEKEKAIDNF